jgi:protein required for attachment to host cells
MQRTCIAVVDATRARLFTLERSSEVDGVHEELTERTDLVNPSRRQTPSHLFSESHSGTNVAGGGRHYSFDDHREAHLDAMDAEFGREIVAAIERTVRELDAHRLILCASPRMLGELRALGLRHEGLVIDELPRDYVKFTPPQIREQLVEHGLLPRSPPRPGLAREA